MNYLLWHIRFCGSSGGPQMLSPRYLAEISESLDGVSVSDSISFAQSQLVSVSTSIKFPSLEESHSRHPRNFSVSMSLSLDIQEISQSWWVSVSTSTKFSSLDESRFRHPSNFSVLMSLGLDIQEISQSRWVSVSTSNKFASLIKSWIWHQ